MKLRYIALAAAIISGITIMPGCAVTRGQSTVGEYIDDSTITTQIKSKFVSSKSVDAVAISVETLNGEVQLSGFAKDIQEKANAEEIARGIKGVRSVKNTIEIRR
jgi:hyperosmotically inducible periplasmic protein